MRSGSTSRRVLIVDPDAEFVGRAVEALRQQGLEVHAAADAEAGLRRLATLEPEVVFLELTLPGKSGLWLLRRLRDEYMGARPRTFVITKPDAVTSDLADLDIDGVILKPVLPSALRVAVSSSSERGILAREHEVTRELVKLSFLEGDLDHAFAGVARRLGLAFRATECLIFGTIGDRQHFGQASGVFEKSDIPLWDRGRNAVDAGAPLFAPVRGDTLGTYVAVPIESPGGARLGVVMICDETPRLLTPELMGSLRAFGQRLYGELQWRSVHERIVADRDRLRESSMLDPMLGIWTRTALDHALPGEVSACVRRGEAMTLAVLDIRGLRHLNERHGHQAGDAALRHVAQLLRSTLRTQDIVARFSGDAFAVAFAGADIADARIVLERLLTRIESAPFIHVDVEMTVSLSAGLSQLIDADDSGEAALSRAAAAAKVARRNGERIAIADELTPMSDDPSHTGLEAGATLGGMYQVVHEISRGAMGVVYRAEDLGLGRQVALKTLRPDLARDRGFVERFRTEAAMLASLRHENLVQVYAFGVDAESVYFVMELVEGEPLEDRIEYGRHEGVLMPTDKVERFVAEIAAALDTMHRAGILHRDVKPSNILMDRVRRRAVLVDVGIAKKRESEHDPAGTPGFTAPESFTNNGAEGPATDVYGLAATAYMLLTLQPPFGEDTVEAILKRQEAQPPRPTQFRPGLPSALDDVLLRALHPDPKERYASAPEFARTFGEALRQASEDVRAGRDGQRAARPSSPPVDEAHLDGVPAEAPADEITNPHGPELLDEEFDDGPSTGKRQGRPRSRSTGNYLPVPAAPAVSAGFATQSAAVVARLNVDALGGGPVELDSTTEGWLPRLRGAEGAPGALRLPTLREPEMPELAVPHTRGVLFRSAYRVLGARQGAAWVAQVSRQDAALAQALQPQSTLLSWHPTEAFQLMLLAIERAGRDALGFARELGHIATAATFSTFFGADPRALSPWRVLSAADLFWRRYHTWGAVGVARAAETVAEVEVHDGPGDVRVCASTAGILEQVALLAGAKESHVVHQTCEAGGGAACVFRVSWKPGGGQ